jgi:hypothetical protein
VLKLTAAAAAAGAVLGGASAGVSRLRQHRSEQDAVERDSKGE